MWQNIYMILQFVLIHLSSSSIQRSANENVCGVRGQVKMGTGDGGRNGRGDHGLTSTTVRERIYISVVILLDPAKRNTRQRHYCLRRLKSITA